MNVDERFCAVCTLLEVVVADEWLIMKFSRANVLAVRLVSAHEKTFT